MLVPLPVLHIPICTTFTFFPLLDSDRLVAVVDASVLEEKLTSCQLMLTLNQNGELCQVAKAGGSGLEADEIVRCSNVAQTWTKQVVKLIEDRLDADLKSRIKDSRYISNTAENDR